MFVRVSAPASVASVPVSGRVTEVVPVVRSESALVGEKVMTSPPPRVMELVSSVVESEAVSDLPAPMFNVLVPLLVIARPFIVAVPIVLTISSGAFNLNFLFVASQERRAFGVVVPLSKERAAFSVSAVALSELIIQLSDDVLPVAMVP